MTNPYLASDNASAVQKPKRVGKWNWDAVSLGIAISLMFAAPTALLAVYLWLRRDAPIPNGVWPEATMNDYIIHGLGIAHLILGAASLITIWFFHSKAPAKVVLTLLGIVSIPAIYFAILLVTLAKTNKWL